MRYYSSKDVLRITKIGRNTLFRWLRQGLIKKPKRNGRGYLFWDGKGLAELKRFIKDRYTPR